MLGYVTCEAQGASDRLLAEVAVRLLAEGWPLAGVVQLNTEVDPARPCRMDLEVLGQGQVIRISQDLGALSQGCRLDAAALEQAVGLVEAALDQAPRLLLVNKFGKQEGEGRGFRPLIGQALARGIPVLTAVRAKNLSQFQAFAEDMARPLPAEVEALLAWCRSLA